jgi:hypothetical protein
MGDRPSCTQPGSEQPQRRPGDALEAFARRVREQPSLMALDAAAAEAVDDLADAGVDALVLKGPALARALYRSGEHRGYTDVDLLVSPGHLPAARRVLQERGYMSIDDGLGIVDLAGASDAETWLQARGADSIGVMIDLHWRLPGSETSPQTAWVALSGERGWIELEGRRVATLSREGLALHVATHAAQHGVRYGRPIDDLTLALERWSPDIWRGAETLAAAIGATAAFAAGLRLVPRGAALAADLGLPAADAVLWSIANRKRRPRGTFHLEAFTGSRGVRERLQVLRRSLFPRREWIAWQYPWARKTGARLMLARALHLMRAPIWAAKAWRFRRQARSAKSKDLAP